MIKEVYIVTNGQYSDYHIVGTFTDKAKADTFIQWKNAQEGESSYEFEVETWEINDGSDTPRNLKDYWRADKTLCIDKHFKAYWFERVVVSEFRDDPATISTSDVRQTVKEILDNAGRGMVFVGPAYFYLRSYSTESAQGAKKSLNEQVTQIKYELNQWDYAQVSGRPSKTVRTSGGHSPP